MGKQRTAEWKANLRRFNRLKVQLDEQYARLEGLKSPKERASCHIRIGPLKTEKQKLASLLWPPAKPRSYALELLAWCVGLMTFLYWVSGYINA